MRPSFWLLVRLGVPAFGLTFAVTMLSAYLPSILNNLTNPIIIGLIIGAEGFFGLFMPLLMGNLADRARTVRQRFRYIVPATLLMAASLCLMGLFNRQLAIITVMVGVFYLGYYSYLAPYWAIYPDLVPKAYAGRSRSAESAWRVIGALAALLSGGWLLSVWQPLPFVLAAALVPAATIVLFYVLSRHEQTRVRGQRRSILETVREAWQISASNSNIRNLLIANALWNATLRSILIFTVLFFTVGLGRSHHFVSGVIFPIAAIGMLVMAPLSGKLADRYGSLKVLTIALFVYGLGDLLPVFTLHYWVVFVIPLVAGAATTVMTLPFAILMRLLEDESHGEASGLFGLSRGVGSFLGPLLTGVAVTFGRPLFPASHGYAAFWLASGLYIIISLPFVRSITLRHNS